ncbi:hypothetical protein OXYTRIMIC_013 [Oxytricha trifallax]|uniref:Uncharacterized protein n=1 Tax=Oxytricha trifallax TaxID=1172189 RepID=A0A073IB56_9SPIT|nr:hypothetical protein OXYTRIMIC_013 [Oxytricha trifallax]
MRRFEQSLIINQVKQHTPHDNIKKIEKAFRVKIPRSRLARKKRTQSKSERNLNKSSNQYSLC